MDRPRFFHHPLDQDRVQLRADEAHHLLNVLRMRPGQEIELFDGLGKLAAATICETNPKNVLVKIDNASTFNRRQTGRIIIAAGIAKGQRFDWMLSKCTELGADHIAAVLFSRSVRLGCEDILQKHQKHLIAACKQSKRLFLPDLGGPQELRQSLDSLTAEYPNAGILFGGFGPKAITIAQLPDGEYDKIVFIGPEGGFTEEEKNCLTEYNALEVKLSANVLRTETAAVAFTAVLEALRTSP